MAVGKAKPKAKRAKIETTMTTTKSDVVELTDKNFDAEIDCDDPVLVDFTAPWCGPCQAVAPVIETLATAYKGKLKIGKLDIDRHPKTTDRFGVKSIPTMLIFKDGAVVGQLIGAASKAKIEATIKKHL